MLFNLQMRLRVFEPGSTQHGPLSPVAFAFLNFSQLRGFNVISVRLLTTLQCSFTYHTPRECH
eukprot:2804845-Rhodomonas_salina.1